MNRFEIYQDNEGGWRWRLKSGNGRVIADSGESYAAKSGAVAAMRRLRDAQLG